MVNVANILSLAVFDGNDAKSFTGQHVTICILSCYELTANIFYDAQFLSPKAKWGWKSDSVKLALERTMGKTRPLLHWIMASPWARFSWPTKCQSTSSYMAFVFWDSAFRSFGTQHAMIKWSIRVHTRLYFQWRTLIQSNYALQSSAYALQLRVIDCLPELALVKDAALFYAVKGWNCSLICRGWSSHYHAKLRLIWTEGNAEGPSRGIKNLMADMGFQKRADPAKG